jgi:hypothetical protein
MVIPTSLPCTVHTNDDDGRRLEEEATPAWVEALYARLSWRAEWSVPSRSIIYLYYSMLC